MSALAPAAARREKARCARTCAIATLGAYCTCGLAQKSRPAAPGRLGTAPEQKGACVAAAGPAQPPIPFAGGSAGRPAGSAAAPDAGHDSLAHVLRAGLRAGGR